MSEQMIFIAKEFGALGLVLVMFWKILNRLVRTFERQGDAMIKAIAQINTRVDRNLEVVREMQEKGRLSTQENTQAIRELKLMLQAKHT